MMRRTLIAVAVLSKVALLEAGGLADATRDALLTHRALRSAQRLENPGMIELPPSDDPPGLQFGSIDPHVRKTGTTIAGIVCRDGVIIGADTRATEGNTVADKQCNKVSECIQDHARGPFTPPPAAVHSITLGGACLCARSLKFCACVFACCVHDQVHELAPNIWCCGAGSCADAEQLTRAAALDVWFARHEAALASTPVSAPPTLVVAALASLRRRLLRAAGALQCAIVLGGVDASGPSL